MYILKFVSYAHHIWSEFTEILTVWQITIENYNIIKHVPAVNETSLRNFINSLYHMIQPFPSYHL
jgi:hypothetical protein